jgi:hypothetical protein
MKSTHKTRITRLSLFPHPRTPQKIGNSSQERNNNLLAKKDKDRIRALYEELEDSK